MPQMRITLFGKFCLLWNGRVVPGLEAQKTQELFSYLLLNRLRPHPREKLASLLWGRFDTSQSKRYLRQALWQIQSSLNHASADGHEILEAELEWLRVAEKANFWLDVDQFEQAYILVQDRPGSQLDRETANVLKQAIGLYKGDLLENWYQDWCIFERERLRSMFLSVLEKLMGCCEQHQDYESGIEYGTQILRYDRAHESSHRRIMRMYYLNGDRTGALRQYERCANALQEELGVMPARSTVKLYQHIQADDLPRSKASLVQTGLDPTRPPLPELIDHLDQLQAVLAEVQGQVEQRIEEVKLALQKDL